MKWPGKEPVPRKAILWYGHFSRSQVIEGLNCEPEYSNTGMLISPWPDLLPDAFCLMVRIFLLMLVLLYIQIVLIFIQLWL